MDLKEFVKRIEEAIEKEDVAREDTESKRKHLAEIFETMVKKRRGEIDIKLWRGDNLHDVRFFSNGTLKIDGVLYELGTMPKDALINLETIVDGTFEENIIVKTKKA